MIFSGRMEDMLKGMSGDAENACHKFARARFFYILNEAGARNLIHRSNAGSKAQLTIKHNGFSSEEYKDNKRAREHLYTLHISLFHFNVLILVFVFVTWL